MKYPKYLEAYDKTIKIGDAGAFPCFSEKKLKDVYRDEEIPILGETCVNNRKEKIEELKLEKKTFVISEDGKHSSLFFRTAGFIQIEDTGEYVRILKRDVVLLWIFFGVLAAIIITGIAVLGTRDMGIIPPDFAYIEDDPNTQIAVADAENPKDEVKISLPHGSIAFAVNTEDIAETGDAVVVLEMYKDGKYLTVAESTAAITAEGIEGIIVDFPSLTFELLPGKFVGRLTIKIGDKTYTYKVLIRVVTTTGGQVTIAYSNQVLINLKTKEISMSYEHGDDATDDAVLQLILDSGGKEYLLAQSGVLHAGDLLTKMTLDDSMTNKLTKGEYHGRLRIVLNNSRGDVANTNADINIKIKVK